MTASARSIAVFAVVLWAAALGRDRIDAWVDATLLPPVAAETSVEVLDRGGELLRAYTVDDGRWRMAAKAGAIDPNYIAMLIRYEDRRFYDHNGVDSLALARAAWQSLWAGRIVSGGSTLTMQAARLLENTGTGRWSGKLRQIRVAWALERRYSKSDILSIYLERAPFGGNIEGVRAAAFAWLGKPPARMTPSESALLVSLPQAPEARRPDRHPDAGRAGRDRVLRRMARAGLIDSDSARAAEREPVPTHRREFPALAPHLADRARRADPLARVHATTIDAALQSRLESLAQGAVGGRSDRLQIAMLVADHETGEILASVGSAGFDDVTGGGFVDLTQALRSPGSTLKPLVYGLSFDRGLAHPETLIADRPTDFQGYRPQNFDGLFRGELRVREALQLSLNLPVVSLTQALGPHQLIAGLRRAGAAPDVPGGKPGLAVALGGVGLTLEDLVRLYAAIAGGGTAVDLHWRSGPRDPVPAARVMGEVAAWQVADILLDVPRPIGVRGTGIAYKTGTSYGHRDAWAIGFDGRHVVGVWMGRADGTPVPGAFGGELAAPVMVEAFERLKPRIDPIPPPPAETLLLPTAQLPLPLQRFREPGSIIDANRPEIAFPPNGAVLEGDAVIVKVRLGTPPFIWLANGAPAVRTHSREAVIHGLGSGFSALTVIDAMGRAAVVRIELR